MTTKKYPNHIGGGIFELSDGRTVEGKNNAKNEQGLVDEGKASYMNNASEPASPVITGTFPDEEYGGQGVDGFRGLSKRERFAMANYAALLTNGTSKHEDFKIYAKTAVMGADALLKELDNGVQQ